MSLEDAMVFVGLALGLVALSCAVCVGCACWPGDCAAVGLC